jgi:hypothetical protein
MSNCCSNKVARDDQVFCLLVRKQSGHVHWELGVQLQGLNNIQGGYIYTYYLIESD